MENKDELLDGIVEAMTAEAEPPPGDGTGWRDALRRLVGEIQAMILRHPATAPLRHAPDHLLRLAMLFCGQCDMAEQFSLGVELMIRGLDREDGEPGR